MDFGSDNPFSVDKAYKDLLHSHKLRKSYFVILSESENLKIGKDHRIVDKLRVVSTAQINDLRKRLLELEMQDGGIIIQSKKQPQKHPIWLYIIDKG